MENSDTVMVALTVEERAERADTMAGLLAEIEAVDVQAKLQAKQHRDHREALLERLQEHGRVLREGVEPRSQMDLFVDQAQAPAALAEIAKHACTCDAETPDVSDPACPAHGVDGDVARASSAERLLAEQDQETADAIAAADQGGGGEEAPDAA